ncbi:membrane protein [Portibacter lacus]|uniref:Membrane protein n=2 Tax=Portibacter lacus TaxID=1099794 RepID=A0AA37SYI4_9BACT|nr:membrane protein [Portibacter lacus]
MFGLGIQAQTPAIYNELNEALPEESNKEFQFIAYFYNHVINTNVYPTSDFLKGQVVGRLFGQNTSTTSDSLRPMYFEQRILPFFFYSPKLFDGRVTLRASFEIDFTWGDGSYSTGGNSGGAISSDFVNLQTQNLEVELIPVKGWKVNLGLQRMYDTPYNPYTTFFEKMLNTSYRLNYWGTDAVGVSVRKDNDFSSFKAGFYQLYENAIQLDDDVQLFEFNYRRRLNTKLNIGGSVYYIRDRGNGQGGPSIIGQGLNSTLAVFNGAYRFPFGSTNYKSDIAWLGGYFSYNDDILSDNLFASGYFNYNLGSTHLKPNEVWEKGPTIGGFGSNLRLGYRYDQTVNDIVWLDATYTSGDQNGIVDDKYSGVVTGNSWGTPAALHVNHGGYLLFPHANVVNRYIAAVTDISNMGLGISAIHVNASKDIIPHKFSTKVGMAAGWSNAIPAGGGKFIGTEINAKLAYQLGVFMSVELHAAYLNLGNFYDSSIVNGGIDGRPANPYTAFISFKWLMF